MRIGIYLNEKSPEEGGGSTLLATIKKEILAAQTEDEFVICYNGRQSFPFKMTRDGFSYLNVDAVRPRAGILYRCAKKLKKMAAALLLRPLPPQKPALDLIADMERIDLFWITYPARVQVSVPYIYTIWDLGHRTVPYFPEVSRSPAWEWEARETAYQQMVYKASYIITGNERGKREILENYPMPGEKVRIVPFPVSAFCRGKEAAPEFALPAEYFFYPAQFWAHKNHIRIIQALAKLKDSYGLRPGVVFTGSDKGNKRYIQEQCRAYGVAEQVIFAGFVPDEVMKYLYTHAVAMVFASLMGPNNIPPIEAAFLGCPVIITNLEGHKEQMGDAALYFDGCDAGELAENMRLLLTDAAARSSLLQKERQLAEQFSGVDYFCEIRNIIEEFRPLRQTWG